MKKGGRKRKHFGRSGPSLVSRGICVGVRVLELNCVKTLLDSDTPTQTLLFAHLPASRGQCPVEI